MIMRESKQQSLNLTDSQFHHEFHNNTSSFHVQSQQIDEPIDYEKMLKAMTQAKIARNQDIDLMVQTLRSHRLTISDVANHSVRAEESSCFEKQDSISIQSFELAQTPNFENNIDSLTSYSFPKIELGNEYDPQLQLNDSILLSDSIMTPVSSPDFNIFSSQHWILCKFI